jgi:hypothetical protein
MRIPIAMAKLLTYCALVVLAGCSASQAPLTPSGALAAHAIREIPAPVSAEKGMYVSAFDGKVVYGYPYNNRHGKPPLCEVTGVPYVDSVGVDMHGNLIVPIQRGTIEVFQGPGMCGKGLGDINDPYGYPFDVASADAVNGTIVVANFYDSGTTPGSLSLCTLKGGCTTNLTNPKIDEIGGVALARNGDCWASATDSQNKAILVYFKGCSGSGRVAVGFQNQSYGGLDIDSGGRLVSLSAFDGKLWVYKGCNPKCVTIGGPFALRGLAFYGHLNEKATRFAVTNNSDLLVDIYSYSPKNVTYLYSFGRVSASSDIGGAAYNPRSKE